MELLKKIKMQIRNDEPIRRFDLLGFPVFQYRKKGGRMRLTRGKYGKPRQDQRVFYLKVHRPHRTSFHCIQHWLNIAEACNAFCYFVCDNKEMEYEIFKKVKFPNLDFCFIPSDRKTLKGTVEKTMTGRNCKKWRSVAHSMLTPFLHAAENNFTRSYNIDADDIRILLAPGLVAKALVKAEEHADREELDCFNLDMYLSRSFDVHWSFGIVYVRTPGKCIEVFKQNENWKENSNLIAKHKTSYVLDEFFIVNIDLMFSFFRDTEQLKMGTFYIENARVVHMPDILSEYWWTFMIHWKDNSVILPMQREFYNDMVWGTLPIPSGLVKIDLSLTDRDYWRFMRATNGFAWERDFHQWKRWLEIAKKQGKVDEDTCNKYLTGDDVEREKAEHPEYDHSYVRYW